MASSSSLRVLPCLLVLVVLRWCRTFQVPTSLVTIPQALPPLYSILMSIYSLNYPSRPLPLITHPHSELDRLFNQETPMRLGTRDLFLTSAAKTGYPAAGLHMFFNSSNRTNCSHAELKGWVWSARNPEIQPGILTCMSDLGDFGAWRYPFDYTPVNPSDISGLASARGAEECRRTTICII